MSACDIPGGRKLRWSTTGDRASRWPRSRTSAATGPRPTTGAAREAALNRFDQFTTTIDGLDIHFIHARSPHAEAFPLLITHGWPGSIVEFHKVIEPLDDPTAFGGDAADAFHVVGRRCRASGSRASRRDRLGRRSHRRSVGRR